MVYEIEDDFEDARGVGIDPAIARRANRMFNLWWEAIKSEFPEALRGDPEHREIILKRSAALLGEFAGLV